MTEELLRDSLNKAQENEQIGLLIWANWTCWDDHAFEMKHGNKSYDFAMSQVTKGEEATIQFEWNGLAMPGFMAVSVQKPLSSNEFFNYVLKKCEEGHYDGPITFIPMNKLSETC